MSVSEPEYTWSRIAGLTFRELREFAQQIVDFANDPEEEKDRINMTALELADLLGWLAVEIKEDVAKTEESR